MAHLTDYLDRFGRREITMADLRHECVRIAGANGPLSADLRHELAAARDAGLLKPREYEGLEFALAAAVLAGPRERPGVVATADEDDGSEDATVLRPDALVSSPDEGSDDETIIRPWTAQGEALVQSDYDADKATVLNRGRSFATDADEATALNRGRSSATDADEATALNRGKPFATDAGQGAGKDSTTPANENFGDADQTVFTGGADPDRTVFVPGVVDEGERAQAFSPADDDRTLVVGVEDDDDRTVVVPHEPEAGDDATAVVRPLSVGSNSTTLNPARGDGATTLNSDKTRVLSEDDAFAGALDEPAETEAGGDNTWDPTTARAAARPMMDRVFSKGSVLKDRFRLTDALGEGGMGTVWRAVDILKLEAEDRNPYVAIKLLQGDFKAHPEAFIALQRESSKQQRLAHPNIATVFDFDREAESGTVFMTMEVMKGMDLADYVKSLPEGGLDYAEAMPLIEQLGSGLSYAHQAGLVHSDLKPGNCFLTNERVVKLLDFGIARASATRDEGEGEETKFDPGTLGALTPSYATIEMFDGLEPDPRDDIYAMAIIAYQLLGGKHPFNRRPAPSAMKDGLTVVPLDKLTKRQNRALARGLAFERENRALSVDDFLEHLRPRKHNLALTVGMPVALAAALILGLWTPVTNYIDEREREAILGELKPGEVASMKTVIDQGQRLADPDQVLAVHSDPRLVESLVALIAGGGDAGIAQGRALVALLPVAAATAVMEDDRVVTSIVTAFRARMDEKFLPDEGRFDFAGAKAQLAELQRVYPNRAEAFQARDNLEQRRDLATAVQAARLHSLLGAGALLPLDDKDDVGDVLATATQMRGDWPSSSLDALLADPTIGERYAVAARFAIEAEDYAKAEQVLGTGLRYAPSDEALGLLSRDVLAELKRLRDAQRARELEVLVGNVWQSFNSIEAFAPIREEMLELSQLAPNSALLGEVTERFQQLSSAGLAAQLASGDRVGAQTLLVDVAPLLGFSELRAAVAAVGVGAAAAPGDRDGATARRVDVVQGLLANAEHTASWDSALAIGFKELMAMVPLNDERVTTLQDSIARAYQRQAAALASRDDYASAIANLERGRAFHPLWQEYAGAKSAIETAEKAYLAKKAQEERLVRLEALKATVLARAQADEPDAAKEALTELQAGLSADDEFLTTQAPAAIGQSYWRLAATTAARDDYESAVRLIDSGLALAPKLAELSASRAEYVVKLRNRALDAQIQAPRDFAIVAISPGRGTAALDSVGRAGARLPSVRPSHRAVVPMARESGRQSQNIALGIERTASGPGVLFAITEPALDSTMATQVADAMAGSLDVAPAAIAALAGPIASYRSLYSEASASAFESRLADAVAEQLSLVATSGQLGALSTGLTALAEVFPSRAPGLRDALAERAGASLVERVRAAGTDVAMAADGLDTYARLFPERLEPLRVAVLANLRQAMVESARGNDGDLSPLKAPLDDLRIRFGSEAEVIEQAVAVEATQMLTALIRNNPGDVARLEQPVRQYLAVVPNQAGALRARVLPSLLEGLATGLTPTAEGLGALRAPLSSLSGMFPDSSPLVADRLSPVIIEALAAAARDQGLAETLAGARVGGELIPELKAPLAARLTPIVADRLVTIARAGEVVQLGQSTRSFAVLFPGAEQALAQRVVPVAVDALVAKAGRELRAVSVLRPDVESLTRDFPGSRAQLERKLAPALIDALVRQVRQEAPEFIAVDGAIRVFEGLFPNQRETMSQRVSSTVTDVLADTAREAPMDQLSAATSAALQLFPDSRTSLGERLGPLIADRLVALARNGDVEPMVAPAQEFGRLLPDAKASIESRVAPTAVDALVAKAGTSGATVASLRLPVETLRRLFPSAVPLLESKLAPVLSASLARAASTTGLDITPLAEPVRAFRALFPDQVASMERRVAESLVEGISAVAATDAARISDLAGPLRDFRALLPSQADKIDAPLSEVLATNLQGQVSGDADGLAALLEPMRTVRALLPGKADAISETVSAAALDAVERQTRSDGGHLARTSVRIEALGSVFPERIPALRQRVAPLVAESVLGAVRGLGIGVSAAADLVSAYASVFPDSVSALRADAAQVVWRAIELEGEKQPGQLAPVADLLRAYQAAFAEDYGALSGALASRTARLIQRNARDMKVPLVDVASMLEQFKSLFPEQHQEVAADVGGSLADRVAGADVSNAQRVAAIGPALREIRNLFPERFGTLQKRLGDKVAKQVQAAVGTDPFGAHELQEAARKVFPDNVALASIKIELPLPEIKKGVEQINKGLLASARKLLEAALAKDPGHSAIPPFKSALEKREKRGLAAYANYKTVVRSSRRASDHTKALTAARMLWRDNASFKDVRPPAPYACIANKAGLGRRIPCYDKVGKRRSEIGPLMVVIPAEEGMEQPFAISKYEVSVTDWNRYCASSKACARSKLKRTLPMYGVSVAQIDGYLLWLSKITNAAYRLPSDTEWRHAANAAGKQPKKDFNCTVTVGSQQLKGLSLSSFKSGLDNGWGVVNYIGNLRELVRDGSGYAVRGGSYKDRLRQCSIDLKAPHGGEGDKLTGFRVVRGVAAR
jgi:serine/threonine protein kinase/tetratricopeptide (TPR) repeat protein